MKLLVPLKGSIQNPTYAPDGRAFLFTRYRLGYALGAADLYIADLRDRERVTLVTGGDLEGFRNIASPGFRSTWHATGIVFSSDVAGLDWPHRIDPGGGAFHRLPGYDGIHIGLNPTLSPSGEEFAFERHSHGIDNPGEIIVSPFDRDHMRLVSRGDARKPSWSPDGRTLVWQEHHGEHVRLVTHDLDSGESRTVTPVGRDFRDATWHPDSSKLVCAGESALYEVTTTGNVKPLYAVEHPRTAVLGSPSWSPDTYSNGRRRILCEGTDRDNPDGGPGTWLELY